MVQTDSILLRCLQIVFNHFTELFFSCLLVLYSLLGLPDILICIFVNMYVLFVL